MGYRSDVRILMGKKGFETFKEEVEKECLKTENCYRLMDNTSILQVRRNEVLIGWSYIKWYDTYEDVRAINAGLEKLENLVEEDEETLEDNFFKLITIGEDGNVETYSNDGYDEFTGDLYDEIGFSEAGYEEKNTKLYNVWIDETERWYQLKENELESFVEKSNVTYEIEVKPCGEIVRDTYDIKNVNKMFEDVYGEINDWGKNNPPLPKVSFVDVSYVMDAIEEMLENAGVTIPDRLRNGNPEEARLFGETFYNLESEIYNILNGTK